MAKPAMKVSQGNPKVPALQHLQTAGLHRVIPVYFKPAPEKKVSRIKAENTAPLEGGIRGHCNSVSTRTVSEMRLSRNGRIHETPAIPPRSLAFSVELG